MPQVMQVPVTYADLKTLLNLKRRDHVIAIIPQDATDLACDRLRILIEGASGYDTAPGAPPVFVRPADLK